MHRPTAPSAEPCPIQARAPIRKSCSVITCDVFPGRPEDNRRVACATLSAVAATDSDPIALQHFEIVPEPVPAEVLGGGSFEVWALRLSGGPVREVLGSDPVNVQVREYVFAVPLDVIGRLARSLGEVYEQQRGAAP
jgi:hypothetical protein